MFKPPQIWYCASFSLQKQTCKVWSSSDKQFKIYESHQYLFICTAWMLSLRLHRQKLYMLQFMAKCFTFLALCVKHTAGHQPVGERDEIIHWWAALLAITKFFDVLLSALAQKSCRTKGNTFTMTLAPAVQILSVSFHASRRLTMASTFFPACQTLYSTDSTTHGKSHTSAVFTWRSGCISSVNNWR